MDLISERRLGMQVQLILNVKCVNSRSQLKQIIIMIIRDVNEAAVVGTLSSGGCYSHISQMFSDIDIPVMNSKTYSSY